MVAGVHSAVLLEDLRRPPLRWCCRCWGLRDSYFGDVAGVGGVLSGGGVLVLRSTACVAVVSELLQIQIEVRFS
jgi:hypothetical protein